MPKLSALGIANQMSGLIAEAMKHYMTENIYSQIEPQIRMQNFDILLEHLSEKGQRDKVSETVIDGYLQLLVDARRMTPGEKDAILAKFKNTR
jgi:hypothetical protein